MTILPLAERILLHFPHSPTDDQMAAINALTGFLSDTYSAAPVFLLKGYAGTGKTSLVAALVKALTQMNSKTVLLAPTGRAAKVFSLYADCKAWTIHRKIYRQKVFSNELTGFTLAPNPHRHTLFIVDEASMIADRESDGGSAFGSGRLLADLVQFVYSGEGCRLILMGDDAQLPPVMLADSPALQADVLRRDYLLTVTEAALTQVVRHEANSDILLNATALRRALQEAKTAILPKILLSPKGNIIKVSSHELIEEISSAYSRDGVDNTIVVVRSNNRAQIYNAGIRSRILYHEEEISAGDRLMVARNNYVQPAGVEGMDFLANGEIVQVIKVLRRAEAHGFRFADLLVRLPDYDAEVEIKVVTDALHSNAPALAREANERLFQAVWNDLAHIATKAEKTKRLKADLFYNAVQIKYAYAVTCHKAQGGQWTNVFLDLGGLPPETIDREFYRWLYTAITRAETRLYLVNSGAIAD